MEREQRRASTSKVLDSLPRERECWLKVYSPRPLSHLSHLHLSSSLTPSPTIDSSFVSTTPTPTMAITNPSTPSATPAHPTAARRTMASPDENSDPSQFSAAAFQASLAQGGPLKPLLSTRPPSPRKALAPSSSLKAPSSDDVLGSLSNRPTRARRTLAAMQSDGDVSLAIAALPGVADEDMSRLLDMTLHLGSLSSPAAPTTPAARHKDLMGRMAALRKLQRREAAPPMSGAGLRKPQMTEEELDRLDEQELERLAWEAMEQNRPATPTPAAASARKPALEPVPLLSQLNTQASPQRRARYRRQREELGPVETSEAESPVTPLEEAAPALPEKLSPAALNAPASTPVEEASQPALAPAAAAPKPTLLRKPSRKTLQPVPAPAQPAEAGAPASSASASITKPSTKQPTCHSAGPAPASEPAEPKQAQPSTASTWALKPRGLPSAPASSPVPPPATERARPSAATSASAALALAPAPAAASIHAAPVPAASAIASTARLIIPERTVAAPAAAAVSSGSKGKEAAQSPSNLPRKSALPQPRVVSGSKVGGAAKKIGAAVAPAPAPAAVAAPPAAAPVVAPLQKAALAKVVAPVVAAEPSPASAPAHLEPLSEVSEPSTSSQPAQPAPIDLTHSSPAPLMARKKVSAAQGPTLPLSPLARSRRVNAARKSASKAVAVVRAEVARARLAPVSSVGRAASSGAKAGPSAAAPAPAAAPVPAGFRLSSTGTLVPLSKSSTFAFAARDARAAASTRARAAASEATATASRSHAGPKANAVPAWLKARKAQLQADEAARLEAELERVRDAELAKGRKASSTSRRIPSDAATAPAGGFVSSMEQRSAERAAWEEKRAHKEALLDAAKEAARKEREAREEQEYREARARAVIKATPMPAAIYGGSSTTVVKGKR